MQGKLSTLKIEKRLVKHQARPFWNMNTCYVSLVVA